MTSIASQFLIARFKGLYEEREEKGKVIIVSSDHQEFRVHSLVLMIRSNILGTQEDCSPDLQERERKTVKVPFPATVLGLLMCRRQPARMLVRLFLNALRSLFSDLIVSLLPFSRHVMNQPEKSPPPSVLIFVNLQIK